MASLPFRVQLDTKKVRVVLERRKTDGPFYARWSWRNKDFFKTTGQFTEAGARSKARQMVEKSARDLPVNQETLTQLVESYLKARWPDGGHTHSSNKSRLNSFAEKAPADFAFLPRRDASIQVQRYLSAQALAAYSVKTDQTVISAFCTWANKHGYSNWESNPAAARYLDLPPTDHKVEDALPAAVVDQLLKATRSHSYRPVILWALTLGARPAEAARATWSDLNLQTRTATLFGKKRQRRVPISDWAWKEFRAICIPRTGRIFPFNYYTIFDHMDDLRIEKKLPAEVTLQALRRTASRRAAEKISVFEYAEFFGHSLEVAKKHYIGWGLSVDRAAVNSAFDYSNPEQNPEQSEQ